MKNTRKANRQADIYILKKKLQQGRLNNKTFLIYLLGLGWTTTACFEYYISE